MKIAKGVSSCLIAIMLFAGCEQKVTNPATGLTVPEISGVWIISKERSILTMSQNGVPVPGSDTTYNFTDNDDTLYLNSSMRYRISLDDFFFPDIEAMSDSGVWAISGNTITMTSDTQQRSVPLTASLTGAKAQFTAVMSTTINNFSAKVESIMTAQKQ